MISNNRHQVRLFSEELELALYDRELELNGVKIIYYYDADVIFPTIMGLESTGYIKSDAAQLVRALLSCGFLGEFHLLRPHALELSNQIERQRKIETRVDQNVFLDRARQFLSSKGINKVMSQLDKIVKENNGTSSDGECDQTKVDNFLEILSKTPGVTFSYIEQIHGTWWERLKRYFDEELLNLDKLGPEMPDLLDRYEQVVREVNSILSKKRPDHTINVFQDAVAMTILHLKIRAKDNGMMDEVVRFYSETSLLCNEIRANPELRDILSYKKPVLNGIATPPKGGLILRNNTYFILRAWFDDLKQGSQSNNLDSLNSLKNLSKTVAEILKVSGKNFEEAYESVKHGGRKLKEIIECFENLSIMGSVWTGESIPSYLKELKALKEWTRVFKFAEKPQVEELVFEQIQNVQEELIDKVSKMRTWALDSKRILNASTVTRRKVPGIVENLMNVLGLVRWGYALNDQDSENMLSILRDLLHEKEGDLPLNAGKVAILLEEARYDQNKCLVMCGVLWGISDFSDIIHLVEDCKNNIGEPLAPSLLVIRAAAEARTGSLDTREKRVGIVDHVWSLLEDTPVEQRLSILLGVGYVLYHTWRLDIIGSGIKDPNTEEIDSEVTEWALKSFSMGEKAYRAMPKNTLAWAYAINHCAYVGIVTGVKREKTEEFFDRLLRLESLTGFWNARFSDTVGSYYLLRAESIWEESSPDLRRNLDLSGYFVKAREYFAKAKTQDVGDTDIHEHENRVYVLEDKIRETKKSIREDEEGIG